MIDVQPVAWKDSWAIPSRFDTKCILKIALPDKCFKFATPPSQLHRWSFLTDDFNLCSDMRLCCAITTITLSNWAVHCIRLQPNPFFIHFYFFSGPFVATLCNFTIFETTFQIPIDDCQLSTPHFAHGIVNWNTTYVFKCAIKSVKRVTSFSF